MEPKNKTEVLEGNSLESFFTAPEPKEEGQTEVEEKGSIDDLFNPPKEEKAEDTFQQSQPKVEEVVPQEPKGFDYSEIIQEFVQDGDWEDVDVEMEVDGEIQKIPITELKDISLETFKQLKQSQKELREEEFKSKYISTENLDETTLKMVELKRAGGDISELIKAEAQMINPIKGLDLDDERVQEYLLREKFRHGGDDQDVIDFKINKIKQALQLDVESKKVADEITDNFKKIVDTQAEKQKEAIKIEGERRKEFKKSLKESFQNLKLDEKYIKPLVDMTSNFDENGLTDVDKAYFQAKKNPDFFAKVAFMLQDEKAYNDFMGVKVKNEANLGTLRKVMNISPRSSTTSSVQKKDKVKGLDSFFEDK